MYFDELGCAKLNAPLAQGEGLHKDEAAARDPSGTVSSLYSIHAS